MAVLALLVCGCGGGGGSVRPLEPVSLVLRQIPMLTGTLSTPLDVFQSTECGLVVGRFNGNDARSVITIDVSSLPSSAHVQSASLRVFLGSVFGTPFVEHGLILLDHVDPGAALGPEDYDGGMLQPGAAVLASSYGQWGEFLAVDVTAQVQADLDAGRATSSFRARFLLIDPTADADWVTMSSCDDSPLTLGPAPTLNVTALR